MILCFCILLGRILALDPHWNWGRSFSYGSDSSDLQCMKRVMHSEWYKLRIELYVFTTGLGYTGPELSKVPIESYSVSYAYACNCFRYFCADTLLPPLPGEIATVGRFMHECPQGLVPWVRDVLSFMGRVQTGLQPESLKYYNKGYCVTPDERFSRQANPGESLCVTRELNGDRSPDLLAWAVSEPRSIASARNLVVIDRVTHQTTRGEDLLPIQVINADSTHRYSACIYAQDEPVFLHLVAVRGPRNDPEADDGGPIARAVFRQAPG